jgi:hypothetical protein
MFQKTRQGIKKRKTEFEKMLAKNKSRISLAVFFGGFVFDALTLTRIDALFGNIILSLYLVLALFSIILMNWGDYKDIKNSFLYKIYKYTPFITQFSFGALFSGFVIYYTASGTLSGSWPFLLALYLVFIANEKFQKYYEKFEFQIGIFFLSLFAFSIFFVPVIAKKIGNEIFIASGIFSLVLIFWIVKFIFKVLPILKKRKLSVYRNIIFVFFIFNLAYFSNIIPPVPLSIKNADIVHKIEKYSDGKYVITKEDRKWNAFSNKWNNIFYKKPGEKIYFFASVFAPNNLKTEVTHQWKKYDTEQKKWINVSQVNYNIEGGRSGGYRGFSFLSEAEDGLWRVDVVSKTNLLIGRESFTVLNVPSNFKVKLETVVFK